MTDQFKRKIFDLIIEDELSEAFDQLQDGLASSDPAFIDVASLKGRFRTLEKQLLRGVIEAEKATLDRNKISEQLMLLVQRLEVKVGEQSHELPANHSAKKTEQLKQKTADLPPVPHPNNPVQGYGQGVNYSGSPCAKRIDLEMRLPYGMAFQRCVETCHKLGFRVKSTDLAGGTLEAAVMGNLVTSFGETLYFWLTSFGGNATQVVMISDSLSPVTLLDWGRNQGNIDKVMAAL